MASATHNPEVVRTVVETPETFSLDLTRDEAETLLIIVRKISGSEKHSRRGHAAGIGRALQAAGLAPLRNYESKIASGQIDFKDEEEPLAQWEKELLYGSPWDSHHGSDEPPF